MDQLNIFGDAAPLPALPPDLLEYRPAVFGPQESFAFMKGFIENVPWQQRVVTMYTKQMLTPRLTAWYGDAGTDYSFSGTKFDPLPWTKELLVIKQKVEILSGTAFNSVLLNY